MLKAIVTDIEEVEEAYRDLYVEEDGKFILQLDRETVRDHPDVLALKNALDREKARRTELTRRVTELETAQIELPEGFSAEEWERLKAHEADNTGNRDDDTVKAERDRVTAAFEKKLSDQKAAHEKAVGELQTKLDEQTNANERLVADTALDRAIDGAGIATKHRDLVRAFMKSKIKIHRSDDEAALPMPVVETDLDPEMPLEKFIKEWANTDAGRVYVDQAKGGGGRGGDHTGGRTGKNPWLKDHWNVTEQTRLFRAKPEEAKRLAKEAGVNL